MAHRPESLDDLIFQAIPAIRKYYHGSSLEPEEFELCQRIHRRLEAKLEERHDLGPNEERIYRLVREVVAGSAETERMIHTIGPVNQTDRMRLS